MTFLPPIMLGLVASLPYGASYPVYGDSQQLIR
jgi:hypothetical protein